MKNPFTVFRLGKKINKYKRKRENELFWLSRPVPGTTGAPRAPGLQWRGVPARRRCPPAERRRRDLRAGPGASSGGPGESRPRGRGCGLVGASPSGGPEQLHLCETPERRGELTAPEWRRSRQLGAGPVPAVPGRACGVRRHRRWPVPTNAPCCAGGTRTTRAQGWGHFRRSLRRHARLSFSAAQPRVSQKAWQASTLAEGRGPAEELGCLAMTGECSSPERRFDS